MDSKLLVPSIIAAGVAGIAGLILLNTDIKNESNGAANQVSYNWDVRPILSNSCFNCHGPDGGSREAGLRLDLANSALAELPESPGRFAVMPGNVSESELIKRISSNDPDVRMPPNDHTPLSEGQVAVLTQWIEEGAEYEDHWAFISPERADVPEVEGNVSNPIDNFILARLASEDLSASEQTDRETLISRVTLTLTGLSPSLEEIEAFINDDSPDAYEKLVDRLLLSDEYAEHMASYWMDLARWSESDGFLDDHHDRFLWPWRDWVINAFKENMPFNDFVTLQLAGDLQEDATREQILATTYLRLGKRTTENGAIDAEYKAEYMIERTDNALGIALMGLTLGCARCHDHKYDPVSQVDYYSLGAFFNSNDEPGFYAPGFSAVQGGPTLPWPSKEQEDEIQAAEFSLAEAEEAYQEILVAASARVNTDNYTQEALERLIEASLESGLDAYYTFDSTRTLNLEELEQPDQRPAPPPGLVSLPPRQGSAGAPPSEDESAGVDQEQVLRSRLPATLIEDESVFSDATSTGTPPVIIQNSVLDDGVSGQALFFDDSNKAVAGKRVGWYERTEPFSYDLWFYVGREYTEPVPVFTHRADINSGASGYQAMLQDNKLWLYLQHSPPANMIAVRTEVDIPVQKWIHMTFTYDGSSRADGVKIYLDGQIQSLYLDHDTLSRTILPYDYSPIFDPFPGLQFGTRFRVKPPEDSAIDELRIYGKELTPLEVSYLHEGALFETTEEDIKAFLSASDPEVRETFSALTNARESHNRQVSAVPQVLVMRDAPEPIPTYVLERGVYNNLGEQVYPRGMEHIMEWDESLPQDRSGLAAWITDPSHPLTARVFVNRIWQNHFGRGIVGTLGDFGAQGEIPSHPQLLDWLAVEFVESGWDVKHLNKLIVNSSTYKQSSNYTEELLEVDPQNSLYARGPRWRMTAEMVRDSALRNAGLLIGDVGGESVYPYQPEGVWNPSNTFYSYPAADEVPQDEHHRRSLYTFIKRSATHTSLQIFDFADRNVSAPARRRSNTPLQSLVLMNDEQFLEAARQLASHLLDTRMEEDQLLTDLYRIVARRIPTQDQHKILSDFFQLQLEIFEEAPEQASELIEAGISPVSSEAETVRLAALTSVVSMVMNSPDAYTVW